MILFLGSVLVMAISFYLLARVCDDYFVGSLEKISKRLNMPSDVAGATLMAMGSSAPELFIALIAVFIAGGGHENLGAGTIVGSALFNILVIIGASSLARTAVLAWQPIVRDCLFYSVSILFLLYSFKDGAITLAESLVFILLYIIYVLAVFYWRRFFPYPELDSAESDSKDKKENLQAGKKSFSFFGFLNLLLSLFFRRIKSYWSVFFLSIVLIAGLSWVLVESALNVAHFLNIPETIIALTILAFGTSVPDLISSLVVAKRGRGGMAISNAVGSNIFDILFGLGVPWAIVLSINPGRVILVDTHNLTGSVILLFATVLATFFIFLTSKWKMGKKGGWILIACYLCYLGYVIAGVV